MGKKSRIKRDRRAGFTVKPIRSILDLPEYTAFVLPAITNIEDLDTATTFPSFDHAIKAADEMGFNEVAQVNCLGPFVLGPTGKMWTRGLAKMAHGLKFRLCFVSITRVEFDLCPAGPDT